MIMEETKRCPYCGEEILAVARKCKHCGEWLDKDEEKEKKVCPVCGELVDSDKEVCPYCNEPTHFAESLDKFGFSTVGEDIHTVPESDSYLYCKSCKAQLHQDTDSCPNCGDKDPFYFKKIKRFETISSWGAAFIILVLLYFAVEYMGFRLNITPEWLGFVCFMVVYFILAGIISIVIRRTLFQSYIRDYEGVMTRLFRDVNHPAAIDRWKAKVEKIL